jgi:putative nucleotidyltransferase with HDIG domain
VPGASTSVRVLGGSQVLLSVIAACSLALLVPDASLAALTTLVVVAMLFVNVGLVLAYETFVWREPIQAMALGLLGSLVASTVVTIPIVALAAWLITQFGPVACAMMFIPLTATQYFHGLYQRKVQLTDELADKAEILARTNLQFAAAMVRALDTRDAYTAGHSAAVAVYTRDIAREMGFDDETIRMAHLSGLLHDIGKIGVPGRVLNKTAPLDDEEYELMKSHAAMGADILGEVDLYADIAILVRYHHERIDGRGYPEGIGGEAIPAISRMISVADTYSAMTTDRPYRDGMPTEKAMSILRECRGTQLDSDFTDAFLRILIVADEAYQRGKQTDFEVEVAKHQAMSQVEAETVRLNDPHPHPAGPVEPDVPMLPAAVDGELVEVELEREAA